MNLDLSELGIWDNTKVKFSEAMDPSVSGLRRVQIYTCQLSEAIELLKKYGRKSVRLHKYDGISASRIEEVVLELNNNGIQSI